MHEEKVLSENTSSQKAKIEATQKKTAWLNHSFLADLRCIMMETDKDHILFPISHFLCKLHKILCSFANSSKKEKEDYK